MTTGDVARCVADAELESGLMREAMLNPQSDQELTDRIDAVLADARERCSGCVRATCVANTCSVW